MLKEDYLIDDEDDLDWDRPFEKYMEALGNHNLEMMEVYKYYEYEIKGNNYTRREFIFAVTQYRDVCLGSISYAIDKFLSLPEVKKLGGEKLLSRLNKIDLKLEKEFLKEFREEGFLIYLNHSEEIVSSEVQAVTFLSALMEYHDQCTVKLDDQLDMILDAL